MADNTQKTKKKYPLLLGTGIFSFIVTIIYFAAGGGKHAGIPFVLTFVIMAFYSRGSSKLKGTAFTFWVFAFLASAMYFPGLFTDWGFNTMKLVVPLLQLIMFGMGTRLSVSDFMKEFKRPKGLLVGTFLVFTIMPVLGFVIAKTFGFPPEIAAGVMLIGACPGGAASNVMAYLANGNVALSVSITAFATLLSPVVTPLLMKLFAGKLIEIAFIGMMWSIMKMIILPIILGLIVNKLMENRKKIIDRVLPLFSMTAILLFVTIVVAHYRDRLIVVGLALFAASIVHNFAGYLLGYWTSKMIGMNERDCRTMAIEVGLKNGGMGMGIAINSLKSADAALAPIIFGKWMNISGSALANYWRQRPTADENADNVKHDR